MAETTIRTSLRGRYETEVRDRLENELGLGNVMQVPRLVKVVVNMGVGEAAQQAKLLDGACLLYTSPSPRDGLLSRMPSSA